jgi:hypothetical protein
MTLTGRAAKQRPDVDTLAQVAIGIATHAYASDGRRSTGAERADVLGLVDPATGAYRSAANSISETDRRALKLRRNGRPRR